MTYLFYNNLEELMNPKTDQAETQVGNSVINSNIIAASIMKHTPDVTQPQPRTQLNRPMSFKLSHKHVSCYSLNHVRNSSNCYANRDTCSLPAPLKVE